MFKNKKIIIISASALFLLLAVFFVSYYSWASNYRNKLLDRTFIGNTNLSEMNRFEVEKVLRDKEGEIREIGIEFEYGDKTITFPLSLQSSSPDIPEPNLKYAESFTFEHDKTIDNLFARKNNSFKNYLKNIIFKDRQREYKLYYSYSPQILKEWIDASFPQAIIEPENAYFSLEKDGEDSVLINNQEKIGKTINELLLRSDLEAQLSSLQYPKIILKTKSKYPVINQAELENFREEAEKLLIQGDFVLYFPETVGDKEEKLFFEVEKQELITWVSAKADSGSLTLEYDTKKIKKYLEENVAKSLNIEVTLPRFDIEGGKVVSWRTGKNGREISLATSSNNIIEALSSSLEEAEIEVYELNVADFNDGNDFKIEELIGTGHSNFAGSSYNRRHNIKVGADAIHGILIKPGEEFSLVENLGEIDAAGGYLPELVIKGNKTIPEYGGGLCQVATTIFRSALGSGLPITARRNHSYRVSYYEPAGTDATVYDPWPDIKFLNDTNNYVLIQSRIEGNDIYFDFWGTKDGRIATTTDPVIYNIVAPPPTKIIETDELAPGEKKCTERAHNGADAYFDYIVIYPEGATTTPHQEVRFRSHYVPWQEVCLVGKEVEVIEENIDDKTEEINEEEESLNANTSNEE